MKREGFTLIELMIVVVIIGALAAMVAPKLSGLIGKSKNEIAKGDLSVISGALDRFEVDNERFPTTDEGLNALMTKPGNAPNWNGPYLKKDPQDPWKQAYRYACPGSKGKDYDIWSIGADGKDGTQDDIHY